MRPPPISPLFPYTPLSRSVPLPRGGALPRRPREDRGGAPPGLRRLRGISDEFQPDVDRIRIVREFEPLLECGLFVEAKVEDAVLVQARFDVAGDRRPDAGRGPVRPDRPDGGSLLDAASEADQGIAEVSLEGFANSGSFGDRQGQGRGRPFFLFGGVTIGPSFDPAARDVSHGAAPGPCAPACGTRPNSTRSRA